MANFNQDAAARLDPFIPWVKEQLIDEPVIHVDETGVNISGKRQWLHVASSEHFSCFHVHTQRGKVVMDEMGILPHYLGTACHDHWKPYYRFSCLHSLCNAHHLRELERAWEQDQQQWAFDMKKLLLAIHTAVDAAGGVLDDIQAKQYRQRYRSVLRSGDKECPAPDESQRKKGARGRMARSTARNLLERLRQFEDDTLRFMTSSPVPFTNNRGERDIRMTKLQQKISGCFRSITGAQGFCRIRSYLSTCRKNNVSATDALTRLMRGEWPDFIPLT